MPRKNRFRFRAPDGKVPRSVPLDVKLVWVQCKQYRCLAWQNADGKWVNFYTGQVLTSVLEVIG